LKYLRDEEMLRHLLASVTAIPQAGLTRVVYKIDVLENVENESAA
jgi:hypothetical protein